MPRLNVFVSEELHDLIDKWRGRFNLSEICARALEAELRAVDIGKATDTLLSREGPRSEFSKQLRSRLGLRDVLIAETELVGERLREQLGKLAAAYVDQFISEGATLALAGGKQIWAVVNQLQPRNVLVALAGVGFANDSEVFEAHPNTSVTIAWLRYRSGSKAYRVGAAEFSQLLFPMENTKQKVRIVVASCAPFDTNSPFSELLGTAAVRSLVEAGAVGDFCYNFFDAAGESLLPPIVPGLARSLIDTEHLRSLVNDDSAHVLLVAGGREKHDTIAHTIRARLCNVLVTNRETGEFLMCLDPDKGVALA